MNTFDTPTASTFTPPTIESEVTKFCGRTMERYNKQGFETAFGYFWNITQCNLRDQNAVQMLLDRLPPEFAPVFKEHQEAAEKGAIEAKAKADAEAIVSAEKAAKHQKDLDAFWAANPPEVMTAAELEDVDLTDEEELFAILARYRISKVEYTFQPAYHWDEFECIEDHDTYFWVSDELQLNHSSFMGGWPADKLPGDDEDGSVQTILEEAVHGIAEEYASKFANNNKIDTEDDGGTVMFDIAARKIVVSAECEVTQVLTKTFDV